MRAKFSFLCGALLLVACFQANAAEKTKSEPAQASPVVLSGTSGDWSYRCVFPATATTPQLCAMEQRLTMQDAQKKTVPLGAVILARATDDPVKHPLASHPWRLTLITPLGFSLRQPVQFSTDDSKSYPVDWNACIEAGCLASIDLTQQQLAAFRQGKMGRIVVGKIAGGNLTINFSLAGADTGVKRLEDWTVHPPAH